MTRPVRNAITSFAPDALPASNTTNTIQHWNTVAGYENKANAIHAPNALLIPLPLVSASIPSPFSRLNANQTNVASNANPGIPVSTAVLTPSLKATVVSSANVRSRSVPSSSKYLPCASPYVLLNPSVPVPHGCSANTLSATFHTNSRPSAEAARSGLIPTNTIIPATPTATATVATRRHLPRNIPHHHPMLPAAYPNHAARESPATNPATVAAAHNPANAFPARFPLSDRHTHAATPAQAVNPLQMPLFPKLPTISLQSRHRRNPSVASSIPYNACADHAANNVHHPHNSPFHPHALAAAYSIPPPASRHATSPSTVPCARQTQKSCNAAIPATVKSIPVIPILLPSFLRHPANKHPHNTAPAATTASPAFTPCKVASPASHPHGTNTATTIAIHPHRLPSLLLLQHIPILPFHKPHLLVRLQSLSQPANQVLQRMLLRQNALAPQPFQQSLLRHGFPPSGAKRVQQHPLLFLQHRLFFVRPQPPACAVVRCLCR